MNVINSAAEMHTESHLPEFLQLDILLILVTWTCFGLFAWLMSKFAWKPILAALDAREEHLKKSVEDADKIRQEMEQLADTQKMMIREAEDQAKDIIEDSRRAAKEAARHITDQAREEAQIILQNAARDVKEQVKEAQAALKEVGASVAVELASKIIEEHLDEAKSKKLISKYIDDL